MRPGIEGSATEAPHSLQRRNANQGVTNCLWVFKWTAAAPMNLMTGDFPTTFSATWNLLFFYSPGWYWFDGEGEDFWSSGGWSFYSTTLGAYHCLSDD